MPMLIDVAELAGLVAEATLYGIFLTLVSVASYGYFRSRSRPNRLAILNWQMSLAGGLLLVLCTTRLVVDTANVFVAYIGHENRTARIAYLTDVRAPLFTTKHSLLVGVLLVGDSFVNWRCWVVWGKKIWIVIVPIILSLVSAVSGAYTMWAYGHLPSQEILSEARWLTSFFSLSLVANAISTSLLAGRIWFVQRRSHRLMSSSNSKSRSKTITSSADGRTLTPVLKIILESGVLNAAYLLAYVICLATKSQGLEVMSEMACPLTGIIFATVIIRVGFHSQPDAYWTSPGTYTLRRADGNPSGLPNNDSAMIFAARDKKITTVTTVTTTLDEDVSRKNDLEMGDLRGQDHVDLYNTRRGVPL